jgi:YegS/Rv2252/BmrU family lipid kinase
MTKKIHIVINPASGQPQPILNQINRILTPAGIDWDVSITHKTGDAAHFARKAIDRGADVIAAYGGDGTVMDVSQVVQGGDIPMAILPGGTANLMSIELGIPKDLTQAVQIMVYPDNAIRKIDIGQAGDRQFLLRLGMGFDAEKVKLADRELKNRWGILAYSIAGLKALTTSTMAQYHITVDGEEYEVDGTTCIIDNSANLGMPGVSASPLTSISDGLLDVTVIRDSSLSALIAQGEQMRGGDPNPESLRHWQGKEIHIDSDPPQTIQADGELWGNTPITVEVLPGVLPILTLPAVEKSSNR